MSFLFEKSISPFFPARVYVILSGQLLVTALSCIFFGWYFPNLASLILSPTRRRGTLSPFQILPWVGFLTTTISWSMICSSPNARRSSPQKWIWLSLFTLGESFLVGLVSCRYRFRSVIMAMITTSLTTFMVSASTILWNRRRHHHHHHRSNNIDTTKYSDLSQWGAGLSS